MKANKAFTLVEILLVVVVIGIVLALAAPNFSNGYSRFQLNKTADDLLDCSRWAQAMAIGQERIYSLTFSDDQRSYRVERIKAAEEGSDDQESFVAVNGALGRMHPVPDTIRINADLDRIEFYPDGTIDPVTIKLNSSEQQAVLSSTQMRGMMTKVESE